MEKRVLCFLLLVYMTVEYLIHIVRSENTVRSDVMIHNSEIITRFAPEYQITHPVENVPCRNLRDIQLF